MCDGKDQFAKAQSRSIGVGGAHGRPRHPGICGLNVPSERTAFDEMYNTYINGAFDFGKMLLLTLGGVRMHRIVLVSLLAFTIAGCSEQLPNYLSLPSKGTIVRPCVQCAQ
jgi:hypothetical protein